MTADEIMALLAAYGEDRFYQRFVDGGPRFIALHNAIQQVVAERDDLAEQLRKALAVMRRMRTDQSWVEFERMKMKGKP